MSKTVVYNFPLIELSNFKNEEILTLNNYIVSDEKYSIKIISQSNIGIYYDSINQKIKFFILPNTKFGYYVVPIEIQTGRKTYNVDVIIKYFFQQVTKFTFIPKQPVSEVYLAGSFNNWNPRVWKMHKSDDGKFFYETVLLPGKYSYKFVLNGKTWISDPENPNKEPDGFGGFNSVIEVSENISKGRLIPITKKEEGDIIEYLFYVEEIDNLSVVYPILDNKLIPLSQVSIEKNVLKIKIQKEQIFSAREKILSVYALTNDNIFLPALHISLREKNDFNIIYFLFIDRFYNGDLSNDAHIADPELDETVNFSGGDFVGIRKKIEEGYFTKLAVDTIWLSPVYKAPDTGYRESVPPYKKYSGYHGYWPIDFYSIEPRYGTFAELRQIIDVSKTQGINVILDMVFNHCHEENEIYKKNLHWFGKVDLPDGRKNIRLFDDRPLDTWFDTFLPDFDYENNPEAEDWMVNNAIWWINQTNCAGFRLDAVKHIPLSFWYKLKRKIVLETDKENFLLLGETISSREEIMKYVSPGLLTGQFDFPLYWTIKDVFAWETASLKKLDSEVKIMEKMYRKPYSTTMCLLLGNHDFARFATFADGKIRPGEDEKKYSWENKHFKVNPETYKKFSLSWSFLLTQPYLVMIYYGDEIGLPGAGDPDNRRKMMFETIDKYQKNLLSTVQKLTKLKKTHIALQNGVHTTLHIEDDIYVYLKQYFDDYVIVAINRSSKDSKIKVSLPEYLKEVSKVKEYFTQKVVNVKNGILSFSISGKSSKIFIPYK